MGKGLPPVYTSTGLSSCSNSPVEMGFAGQQNGFTSEGDHREVWTA